MKTDYSSNIIILSYNFKLIFRQNSLNCGSPMCNFRINTDRHSLWGCYVNFSRKKYKLIE